MAYLLYAEDDFDDQQDFKDILREIDPDIKVVLVHTGLALMQYLDTLGPHEEWPFPAGARHEHASAGRHPYATGAQEGSPLFSYCRNFLFHLFFKGGRRPCTGEWSCSIYPQT